MQAAKIVKIQEWNITLWGQQKNPKNSLFLVIMLCGFQRAISHT
jgi:hypothetical protein